MGCRVVGTTRGDKCRWLVDELGFDAAVDYTSGNIHRALKEACPNGIDVYFDNTGGEVLGAALSRMNPWGRVACCGAVANYDTGTPAPGPAGVPGFLVTKRLRMEGLRGDGFLPPPPRSGERARRWVAQGRIKAAVDVVEGFEKMPAALAGMFAGENRGSCWCGSEA
ncbi:MAG: zinc-binding dehydrogenase [Rhizomicrobium sp.]